MFLFAKTLKLLILPTMHCSFPFVTGHQ